MKKEKLYFITGNNNKFAEIKAIIPDIEQLELDLEEIQEIDHLTSPVTWLVAKIFHRKFS